MTDEAGTDRNDGDTNGKDGKGAKGGSGPSSSGDAVYALGVIGACVYFWKKADTPGQRAVGMLKGLVWPAFLVYEAFSAVSGRPSSAGANDSDSG